MLFRKVAAELFDGTNRKGVWERVEGCCCWARGWGNAKSLAAGMIFLTSGDWLGLLLLLNELKMGYRGNFVDTMHLIEVQGCVFGTRERSVADVATRRHSLQCRRLMAPDGVHSKTEYAMARFIAFRTKNGFNSLFGFLLMFDCSVRFHG